MQSNLKHFFTPQSIAILGASTKTGTMGWRVVNNLKENGYEGKVYPINPQAEEILGYKVYRSISEVGAPIDTAYCALAAEKTIEAFEECEKIGVKFIIMISSGFAEIGEEGAEIQRYITEFAKRTGIRILGPNCQGAINFIDNTAMSISSALFYGYTQGSIGIVSQSGSTGHGIFNMAAERGMGLAYLATTGNEADLSTLDFIDYMLDDDKVSVIVGYLEGIKDIKRFFALGKKSLAIGKPIILLKPGKTDIARKAITSHTAALAASDYLYSATFQQAGIIRVNDVDELLDTAYIFSDLSIRPKGNRVAVSSTAGGVAVMLTDACSELGMDLPELQDDTAAILTEILPAFSTAQNPLDMTAQVINNSDNFSSLCTALANDPSIDMLIIGIGVNVGKDSEKRGELVYQVAEKLNKPMVVCWLTGPETASLGHKVLKAHKVPVFYNPYRTAKALSHVVEFESTRKKQQAQAEETAYVNIISEIFPPGETVLAEYEAKKFMAANGFIVTGERLVQTAEEAITAANEFGYPVVMKINSPQVLHKTEAGGVKLNLRTPEEVGEAFAQILSNVKAYNPEAEITGILVQEMITSGEEIILGSTYDPQFGSMIMFGLGGIYVEIAKDVAFRMPPISKGEAMDMIKETKMAYSVLKGARGKAPGDIDAMCETISRFSYLVNAIESAGTNVEIDLNPIVVLPEGKGVKIVDALIIKK